MDDAVSLSMLNTPTNQVGGVPLSTLATLGVSSAYGMPDESLNQPVPPSPDKILSDAKSKYGFIAQHNPTILFNPGGGRGYAETWPIGEEGDKEYPRPKSLPINQHGIEIYKPGQFGPDDVAGEVMHLDPRVNQARDALMKTFTPDQIKQMEKTSNDYKYTEEPELKLQNGTDALLRKLVIGQKSSTHVDLTPHQQWSVDALKDYVIKGR